MQQEKTTNMSVEVEGLYECVIDICTKVIVIVHVINIQLLAVSLLYVCVCTPRPLLSDAQKKIFESRWVYT